MSTFVYRGFDQVWEELDDKCLGVSTTIHIPGTDLEFYNNAVLMAKKPHNAVLLEWQKRVNAYMEDPCLTTESVLAHPSFQRLKKYLQTDAMGITARVLPYGTILILLTDMLWFDKHLQKLASAATGIRLRMRPVRAEPLSARDGGGAEGGVILFGSEARLDACGYDAGDGVFSAVLRCG